MFWKSTSNNSVLTELVPVNMPEVTKVLSGSAGSCASSPRGAELSCHTADKRIFL